ncbi:MAG: cbb3-type cytochrome c oxidase subunit 3 [Xanthomonadales bacterium]|nr:cbb3-type cytochrome c oxidase subunit 3 [Xanthomonadales bacterium]
MDLVTFRSTVLVILFITFCVLVFWAWSPKRKQAFEEAAQLAVEDDLPKDETDETKETQP